MNWVGGGKVWVFVRNLGLLGPTFDPSGTGHILNVAKRVAITWDALSSFFEGLVIGKHNCSFVQNKKKL